MVAVGIMECGYVGNVVISGAQEPAASLHFCLAQLVAMMTTATVMRARRMEQACHKAGLSSSAAGRNRRIN
jgi:hypothetical protein